MRLGVINIFFLSTYSGSDKPQRACTCSHPSSPSSHGQHIQPDGKTQPLTALSENCHLSAFKLLKLNPKLVYRLHARAKSLQLCVTLCNPIDCSPPGSSVHGFLRQEFWSRLSCPPPQDFPDPGIEHTSLMSPALAVSFFTISGTWEAP